VSSTVSVRGRRMLLTLRTYSPAQQHPSDKTSPSLSVSPGHIPAGSSIGSTPQLPVCPAQVSSDAPGCLHGDLSTLLPCRSADSACPEGTVTCLTCQGKGWKPAFSSCFSFPWCPAFLGAD